MSDLVQNVINQALGDGARPTKFRCQIVFPDALSKNKPDDIMFDAMCKTTQFGNKFNETILVKYRGRDIPVPGQEKFSNVISVGLYLEENHSTKNLFYQWMQGLNYDTYQEKSKNTPEVQDMQDSIAAMLYGTMIVTQLDFEGETEMVRHTYYGIFPKELDAINADSTAVSTISEYACTFSYSYYDIEILDGSQPTSSDIANSILGGVQGFANDIINKAIGFIPGLDSLNSAASSLNKDIQKAGKSIATTASEFLG